MRAKRLAALFGAVGPPIGAILPGFYILFEFGTPFPPESCLEMIGVMLLLSYPIGGLPALLTGFGAGRLLERYGKAPLWLVLLVAQAATVTLILIQLGINAALFADGIPEMKPSLSGFLRLMALSVTATVPATIVCWGIARRRGLL